MNKQIEKFTEWITRSEKNARIAKLFFRHYRIRRSIAFLENYDAGKSWQKIQDAINRKRRIRLTYISTGVAAALAVLFAMSYFLIPTAESPEAQVAPVAAADPLSGAGSRKATLTLDTGEEIDLSAHKQDFIANGEDTLVTLKPNESLTYKQTTGKAREELKYNILTVPRGGEYLLVLSDGTKVWLNAESRLHYPVSFGQTRDVRLSGEAYFEVAESNTPFTVQTDDNSRVEVMGTKFNISAYANRQTSTTLAEGKVRVTHSGNSVVLSPNQRATIEESGNISLENVDARLFTSWAQGVYQFRRTRLSEIIDQLSRWYDADIHFENEQLKNRIFTGVIFRYNELGFAIETIEKISTVKFRVDNDKIYISDMKKESLH